MAGAGVLVFTHRYQPDAGLQVPAGTVAPGEAPEAAAYREVAEESGLMPAQVRLVRKLAEVVEPEWQIVQRHAYLFAPVADLPERWNHTVAGAGEDQGMVFDFDWLPVSAAQQRLAGRQGRCLHLASA